MSAETIAEAAKLALIVRRDTATTPNADAAS